MKKFIALILASSFLSMCVSANTFTDVKGVFAENTILLLCDLGIMKGKSATEFDPDGNLTRAEMVAVTLRLLGVSEGANGREIFRDVPSSHWAYHAITVAYDMKLINGMGNDTFEPDQSLSYPAAVKMLISALGYAAASDAIGGYPSGYLAKAAQLGLLKGVVTTANTVITRGSTAVMLTNALEIPLLLNDVSGNSFTIKENVTILSEYLKIEKFKGRITDTYFMGFHDDIVCKNGEVILDGNMRFPAGKTAAESMLGKNVTLYVTKDDHTIISAILARSTQTIEIDTEDLLPESTSTGLVYADSNKTKSLPVSDSCIYMENGVKGAFKIPASGTITVISDDGTYADAIIMDTYKDYWVKTTSDEMIYFKGDTDINEINLHDAKKVRMLNTDGSIFTPSDVSKNDVLSVAFMPDGTIKSIIRSTKTVQGTISELTDNHKTAVIDTETYSVSLSLENSEVPALGEQCTFFLNFKGVIAFVEKGTSDEEYAWLVNAAYTPGLSFHPEIRLFTESGEMKVFNTAKRVEVTNGTNPKRIALATELLHPRYGLTTAEGVVKPQMIKYKADGDAILRIKTAAIATDEELITRETREQYFTLDYIHTGGATFLGGNLRMFLSKFHVPKTAVGFNIPPDKTKYDDYYVINVADMSHNSSWSNLVFYDLSAGNAVSAFTASSSTQEGVSNSAVVALVTNITSGLNENQELVSWIEVVTYEGDILKLYATDETKLFLGQNGTNDIVITDIAKEDENVKTGEELKDRIAISDLNLGDVIAYDAVNERIDKATLRFRINSPIIKEMPISGNALQKRYEVYCHSSEIFWFSRIVYKDETTVVNFFPGATGNEQWERTDALYSAKFIEFDVERGTYSLITADDIHEDDCVFMYRITNNPELFIKYKNMKME